MKNCKTCTNFKFKVQLSNGDIKGVCMGKALACPKEIDETYIDLDWNILITKNCIVFNDYRAYVFNEVNCCAYQSSCNHST